MTLEELLSRFPKARRSGNQWRAPCPAHDDGNPSLSITEGDDGRLLVLCRAGCPTEAALASVGLTMADLFPERTQPASKIVATYDYVEEQGTLLYQTVRIEPGENGKRKDFFQRRPDGQGGWINNLRGVRHLLYRLPAVLKARLVLVLEGEKDVHTAERLGYVGTTNPMGAGKWRTEYSKQLRGKDVVIIADRDEAGLQHAEQVAESLHYRASRVRMLGLPKGKDLTEWVEQDGTAAQLDELIASAPEWQDSMPSGSKSNAERPKIEVFDPPDIEEFLKRTEDLEGLWQVNNLVLAQSYSAWQARPKIGKSHILLQLGYDAACGLPVFGAFQTPKPLRVMYCELEEPPELTKDRLKNMIAANHGLKPERKNLVFFTKMELYLYKILSRELATSRLPAFIRTIQDLGMDLLIIIALRSLLSGDPNDPQAAEKFNDVFHLLRQETKATCILAHHTSKIERHTVEAQGFGSTMLAAPLDAVFDVRRRPDGLRRVRIEARYPVQETFLLQKISKNGGAIIIATLDPKAEQRSRFRQALEQGLSVPQAAVATEVCLRTAYRWAKEEVN